MRILVVEDEDALAGSVVESLEDQSYAVDRAADGASAAELVELNQYDLIVLDWTLPQGPSGLELLARWRSAGIQTPVLMLTGRKEVGDRVDGLDSGADDYLTKPFSFDELSARVRSLLRRRERVLKTMTAGDLELDRAARRVTVAGEEIELAPKEFGILEYLLARLGETVSRTELSEHVWDENFDAMSNVVDVLVYRLRKKIDGGRDGKLLHTIKGVGYVLKNRRE